MSLKLSSRDKMMPESPIRKLAPLAIAAKKKGVKIYHLNIGQPDIKTPATMLEAYKNIPEIIEYGPSAGLREYRERLAEYYNSVNVKVDANEIFVTTGGSEAITFALMSITSPGDEIIIPEPFYTNYIGFSAMSGISVKAVTARIDTGFALPPLAEFKKQINSKTKAIVICNPGNPTGAVFSRESIKELLEFAKENNLFVISDEVYREFTYDNKSATSILEFEGYEENSIVVDSVSKRYSACGARVGCIVTKNKELLQLILKFGQARLCPPTIDQMAAMKAIDTPKEEMDRIIKEYENRRNTSFDLINKIPGITAPKPQGAFYMIVDLGIESAEHFAKWMLTDFSYENETVMVTPAAGFYASKGVGLAEIRIAYVLNENDLRKAFIILAKGLEEYRKIYK